MLKNVVIHGFIVEVDVDYENDDIISLGIETEDEITYVIDGDDMIVELEDYIDEPVEVKGKIWEDEDGEFFIKIDSYTIAEEEI